MAGRGGPVPQTSLDFPVFLSCLPTGVPEMLHFGGGRSCGALRLLRLKKVPRTFFKFPQSIHILFLTCTQDACSCISLYAELTITMVLIPDLYPRCLRLYLVMSRAEDFDGAEGSVDFDFHAGLKFLHQAGDANNGGQAQFAGDDG